MVNWVIKNNEAIGVIEDLLELRIQLPPAFILSNKPKKLLKLTEELTYLNQKLENQDFIIKAKPQFVEKLIARKNFLMDEIQRK